MKVCNIDGTNETDCVLDYAEHTLADCSMVGKLKKEGKGKEDCPHWVELQEDKMIRCPHCGEVFETLEKYYEKY